MSVNKVLLPLVLLAAAVGTSSWSAPSSARTYVDVDVRIAPPPLRHERIPRLERGYVWAPGHWRWNGNRYVWNYGHRVAGRPGHHYVPARWERRGPHWYYRDGYWGR